jgi:hypothetical protein
MAGYEFLSGLICADPHAFVSGPTACAASVESRLALELELVQMGWGRKAGAKQPPRPGRKSQSQQDQEFAERQRIAERLVRALREAG